MNRACVIACIVSLGVLDAAQAQTQLAIGGLGLSSRRNAAFGGVAGAASGIMAGGEAQFRWRFLGTGLTVFRGSFSPDSGSQAEGEITNGDVYVLAGIPEISAEVGYGGRAFRGAFSTTTWTFATIGARSSLSLGPTGLIAQVRFAIYAGVSQLKGTGTGSGKTAETALVYHLPNVPVYLKLGYRFEQFTVTVSGETLPEEVSSVVLGGGFYFGNR